METKSFFKRFQYDLLAIGIIVLVALVYSSPLLEGKILQTNDGIQISGVQKEAVDFYKQTGTYALWTNSLFCGMPTYQIMMGYPYNIGAYIVDIFIHKLPNPFGFILLYFLGFFFFLRCLKFNTWLSLIGALAFGFSSYNFIILEAGHITKALAIGFFAPVMAGVFLSYRGKFLAGFIVAAIGLAAEIAANHIQMSYYLSFAIIIFILIHFGFAIKQKTTPSFFKATAGIAIAAIIAVGINLPNLWLTAEYGKETIRGKSELTLNPESNRDGLSKEYVYQYSYGIMESFTLLVPDFYGGASSGDLGKNAVYEMYKNNGAPNAAQIVKQYPTYWGELPITSGPIYFGAVVMFLFVLGLFVVKGPEKWWVLATFVLSLLLSWGKYFDSFSNLFFDYVPLYNKFRAVESILVIASFVVPFLSITLLRNILEGTIAKEELMKGLKRSAIIVGGLLLVFIVMPGVFGSFTSENDKQIFGKMYDSIIEPLISDRKGLLRADAFRSLVFVTIAAGLIFFYIRKKIKMNYVLIGMGLIILFDMWTVDKRYLNNDRFGKKTATAPRFTPTNADLQILQDKDPDYRVVDFTTNPFTDSRTSYFHKNIGGYHAAKLKRYQELIENQLSKNNMSVYDMLNTKYFIVQAQKGTEPFAQRNPNACGSVWFVKDFRYVANADSEMLALNNFQPKQTAIIDKRFEKIIGNQPFAFDSTATIRLSKYSPNVMNYESSSVSEQLAVFSEVYYDKGWDAYIDGKKSDYVRVNYVLRAMKIPAGKHQIEFRFEPHAYFWGKNVTLASSLILVICLIGAIFTWRRKQA